MSKRTDAINEERAQALAEDPNNQVFTWKNELPEEIMSAFECGIHLQTIRSDVQRWRKEHPKHSNAVDEEFEKAKRWLAQARKEFETKKKEAERTGEQTPTPPGVYPGPWKAARIASILIRQDILFPICGTSTPLESANPEENERIERLRKYVIWHPLQFGKITDIRTTDREISHILFQLALKVKVEQKVITEEQAKTLIRQRYLDCMALSDADWFKSDTHLLTDSHPLASLSGVEGIHPLSLAERYKLLNDPTGEQTFPDK